jgi:hypothetical protein
MFKLFADCFFSAREKVSCLSSLANKFKTLLLDALLAFGISFDLELDLALLVFISTHDSLNNAALLHTIRLHHLLLNNESSHSVLAGALILLLLLLKGLDEVLSAVLELLLTV